MSEAETEPETETESQADAGQDGGLDDDVLLSLDEVSVHFQTEQSIFQKYFGEDPEPLRAVDDVSLDIEEEDVIALVGESGCGKTTLGKTIIGLQRPTEGSVVYRDQDVWDAKDASGRIEIPYRDIRERLQIIHQDPGSSLNPNKTIEHSLMKPLRIKGGDLSPEDKEARIKSLLERVGLTPPQDYIRRYPHQLSGGEQQRVALVRALLMSPDLILADEAVSALDVSLRIDMMDLMLELMNEFSTSFVLISHNLSNARYIAEKADGKIGVMYMGEIVEIGSAEEVIENPQHPYTKALKWSTSSLGSIEQERDFEDMPLRSIDVPDPSNPPSGCKFHTRCPEAREVCAEKSPELRDAGEDAGEAACYQVYEGTHEYWNSRELAEQEQAEEEAGAGLTT